MRPEMRPGPNGRSLAGRLPGAIPHALLAAVLWAGALAPAAAQLMPADPDWKELEAPPPPPLRTSGLLMLDTPRQELRFGVDPASLTVGTDGIVRYVVVATSASGVVNGIYEGVRCSTGEVKVFARSSGGAWQPTTNAEWKSFYNNIGARHTHQIVRTGACIGNGTQPANQIIEALRAPAARN